MTVAEISHAIQSTALFTAVRQSELFYPTVLATHLTCIAIFGGMILMTNLRLLGLALTSTPIASVIDSTRNWKRFGFVLMISCGILLGGSRLDTYYSNPFLQLKLSLLVLIGIHGLVFRRGVYCSAAELDREPRLPLRAKLAGGLSLVLWLSVVTCGRWIAYYDPPEKAGTLHQIWPKAEFRYSEVYVVEGTKQLNVGSCHLFRSVPSGLCSNTQRRAKV